MHYMTVLVIEYESTAYQQYKMALKKLGVFFQFFAREATLNQKVGRIFVINLTLIVHVYNFDIISIKILMVMGITTDKVPHSLFKPAPPS